MHYMRHRRGGDMTAEPRVWADARTRFWSKVKRGQPDECWLWTGTTTKFGYAHFRVNGDWKFVHRYAYEMLYGPIPSKLTIDHLCHNRDETCKGGPDCLHRRCCNPVHMEPIEQAKNWRRSPNNPHNKSH